MVADVVRRSAPTAAILLAVVGLVAVGLAVVGTTGTATGGGVPWPAAIAPIAASVSHDRGLAFVRPVPVHFVTPRTFDRDVAAQTAPTSAATRTDDRRYAAELRALGLLDGSVNVIAAETATDDRGGVLGYYTPTARAVYLRGKALTPAVRVTLAHELTHALQDQHFGLNRLSRHAVTDGEQFGLTALEEGDAVLDEDDYQATLTPAERRQATAQPTTTGSTSSRSTSTGSTSTTVPVLTVTSSVPYVLGPELVNALYAVGGNARVDRAYARPPATELDVLQPTDYLERAGTRSVPALAVPAGDRADGGPQTFGAFTLYLTLAARLPAHTALAAADQWAGGSMRQYRTASGRSCLTAELTGRSAAGTAALASAVSTWAAAMPAGQVTTNAGTGPTATATATAPVVELTACDPGASARAGPETLERALTVASQRNGIEVDALYAGASPGVAACVGRRALADRALLVHGTAARVRLATGRCSP